jgi:hypothetical protein
VDWSLVAVPLDVQHQHVVDAAVALSRLIISASEAQPVRMWCCVSTH